MFKINYDIFYLIEYKIKVCYLVSLNVILGY